MRWLIVVAVFVGALVWLWLRTQDEATVAEDAAPASAPKPAAQRRALTPTAPVQRLVLPERTNPFDAASHHTADPCTALVDPIIPATYEQVTAANITVAWDTKGTPRPYDAPMRPVTLAYAVAGILEEAAELTGTERREKLAVIIDATTEDFQTRMHTPSWVSGLYDGGAVHVPAYPRGDLGVTLAVLRHEVMHAQIHATVGCVPFWFNEGLANYFAGSAPLGGLFAIARTTEPFDITTLRDPEIFDVKAENAHRMYAVSLAMVLYLVHRGGEVTIREAVKLAQSADTIPIALDLWTRIAPAVDYRMIVDSLAQHVFHMPPGPELKALLDGPMCCSNIRSPLELVCGPPPDGVATRMCRRY